MKHLPELKGHQHRPAGQRAPREQPHHRPRYGVRASASPRSPSTPRSPDAYGQRQVSTTYRALNQYHVVMEAAQPYQQSPEDIRTLYVKSSNGHAGSAIAGPPSSPRRRVSALGQSSGPFARSHALVQPVRQHFSLSGHRRNRSSTYQNRNAVHHCWRLSRLRTGVPGFALLRGPFCLASPSSPSTSSSASCTKVSSTPSQFSPRCLPPAWGAFLALLLFKIDLSIIAIIGIILLIGIVKKKCHHDDRLRSRRRA